MRKMKQRVGALVAVAALALGASAVAAATTSGNVTLEQARQTVLTHAGKTAEQVRFVKEKQEMEHGRLVYEIEFVVSDSAGYTEYDYEIDASTGKIVSYDYDAESNTPAAAPAASGSVTLEQARQTALTHAGKTADQVQIVKEKQETERGRTVYEIEFVVSENNSYTEYDYEIDVSTGAIISYDYDIEGYAPAQSAGAAVSEAAAKQTALARVPGATEADIYQFKLDYDDGRYEYEGKIYYNTMKYEFAIDGSTGSITEWEAKSARR